MSPASTTTLTRAAVQRSDLRLSLAVGSSLLVILLSFFWMLFHVGGDRGTILFADTAYAATSLLGAGWIFRVVYKSRVGAFHLERRHELAWLLIGMGLLINSLGGFYYTYLEYIGLSPFPSYADIGFTLFYPFVLIGLLTMPTSLQFRARMGLDAIITSLCLFGISWFFVIGPIYLSQVEQTTTFAKLFSLLLSLSYSCWDIVVIFALLLLIQRRSQPILYPTFLLMGIGILSQTWADTAYAYTNVFTGTYQSGTPSIDPFWFIGYLLMGLAALGQYNALLHRAYAAHTQETGTSFSRLVVPLVATLQSSNVLLRRLQSLLIYVPLVFLLGLTVYGESMQDGMNSHYLVILSAIVGILVTVRYMLATHENEQLSQEMARNHIEYVLLYNEAREREMFLRATANIAVRLNAAVVKPMEIYQLICSEGASALQADYAILYVPDEPSQQDFHDKLIPLAAYEVEGTSQVEQWPVIYAHQLTAKAFDSLQPILMQITNIPTSPISFSPLQKKLSACSVPTAVLAPLICAGEPVGLLIFARSVPMGMPDKQCFGKETLSLAQDFAEQAAIALTNAHLYQHLRSTHERLQELDELKDQFMITASHELRTPLTSVQGYIELLAQYDGIVSPEERQEFLKKAQRSCNELVVLLGNVMDASRIETEMSIRPELLERVDVREMIESVITIIHPQLQQEHRVATVHMPTRLFVRADSIRLRQVLMNLSVNALKYSPPHTPIAYVAHLVDKGNDLPPAVTISVVDKGKGIAPQDQSRLFQRFSRLESEINSPIRGSGLGLYISRRLIELMSGRIWIESSGVPGEGSTFHIQLPACE